MLVHSRLLLSLHLVHLYFSSFLLYPIFLSWVEKSRLSGWWTIFLWLKCGGYLILSTPTLSSTLVPINSRCPKNLEIEFGEVSYSTNYTLFTYKRVASFKCITGYLLQGMKATHCDREDGWFGKLPSCISEIISSWCLILYKCISLL